MDVLPHAASSEWQTSLGLHACTLSWASPTQSLPLAPPFFFFVLQLHSHCFPSLGWTGILPSLCPVAGTLCKSDCLKFSFAEVYSSHCGLPCYLKFKFPHRIWKQNIRSFFVGPAGACGSLRLCVRQNALRRKLEKVWQDDSSYFLLMSHFVMTNRKTLIDWGSREMTVSSACVVLLMI